MRGLHVVADFYEVPENPLLTDANLLRAACIHACTQAGLTVVGERFHQFASHDGSGQAGATGAVILAASHLAIHTWPERAQVTLDIYLCEFEAGNPEGNHVGSNGGSQMSNQARAEAVFAHITGLLKPLRAETQRLERGCWAAIENSKGINEAI
jgi:S-adenosylmethionine decarboxylase proenzyme